LRRVIFIITRLIFVECLRGKVFLLSSGIGNCMEIDYAYIGTIICAFIGIVTFGRDRPSYLSLLPIFLLTSFIIDSIGWWLSSSGKSNILLYSIFHVFLFNFYLFVLFSIVQKPKAKLVIKYIMLVFTILAIANFAYYQGLNHFHSVTYSIGSFCIVAICAYYFLELFRLPHSVNLMREPGFWICSGLIFFFSCGFPIFGSINIMGVLPKVLINNIGILLNILNILLYILYSIAFLCRNNTRKYTQL
jgi:hypothetical protein